MKRIDRKQKQNPRKKNKENKTKQKQVKREMLLGGESKLQWVLGGLMGLYWVLDVPVPDKLLDALDNPLGMVVIGVCVLMLFARAHVGVALIGLLVAHKVLTSFRSNSWMYTRPWISPDEDETRWKSAEAIAAARKFPYTLEQEIIQKMAPTRFNDEYVKTPWAPVVEDTQNAQRIR